MSETNLKNVTAKKTAEINRLKEMQVTANRKVTVETSAVQAFQKKANLYQDRLSTASSRLTLATGQMTTAQAIERSLQSLLDFIKSAKNVSSITNETTNVLVAQVEAVVNCTLQSANMIQIANNLVVTQKAANNLISSQLVSQINEASTTAKTTMALVINTLISVFNALSAAEQSNNAAEMARIEVNSVMQILDPKSCDSGLISTVDERYKSSRHREANIEAQNMNAQKQLLAGQAELASSQIDLQTINASLAAAEAAVGAS